MALFNSRKNENNPRAGVFGAETAPTVNELRRAARQRLIGSLLLVLLGVLVFSLLLDTEPRKVSADLPISVKGVPAAAPIKQAPVKPAPVEIVDPEKALAENEQLVTDADPNVKPIAIVQTEKPKAQATAPKSENKAENKVVAKPEPKPEPKPRLEANADPKPETKVEAKPKPKPELQAKLDLKKGQRVVVHIGSFLDAKEAATARAKARAAGIPTYIQYVDTSKGKYTRVRVGPFTDANEAEKMLEKARAAGLAQAAVKPL